MSREYFHPFPDTLPPFYTPRQSLDRAAEVAGHQPLLARTQNIHYLVNGSLSGVLSLLLKLNS